MTGQPARARDRGEEAVGARSVAAAAGARPRVDREDVLRALGWMAGYLLAVWLGERTLSESGGFALAWPASGVALAWIASAPERLRPVELVVLGVLTALSAYAADHTVWAALNGLVGLPLALVVFLVASRHWTPTLWGSGGSGEVKTVRAYGLLLAATFLAGLTETVVALPLLAPEHGSLLEHVAEIGLTHTIGMATVGVTLLVLGSCLCALPTSAHAGRAAVLRRTIRRNDVVLAAAGVAITAVILLAGFVWITDAPVSFVLVIAVAVVAVRYGAPVTGIYALAVATAACAFTAADRGPIAEIAEPHRRALAFGVFTAALVCTGLTIALSRRERDATIARLRESERAAEVLADDLTLVLANLEEGVAVVEQGGRFLHANDAMSRLLEPLDLGSRRDVADAYQLTDAEGRVLAESDLPHARAFAGDEEVREVIRVGRPGRPAERILEVSGRLLPQIRSTDPPRAVTTIRDVTEEHQQRHALTSFAQVVAHDLRSPLTSVELWAAELLESCRERPLDSETASMMLHHIQSAAGRMQNFISDLLAYALARDQAPSPTPIELTDVVESVVETITAVEGSQPDVQFDDLPAVWCDPVLLPQLFDNLIGNARKYVAEGVVPKVRVEAAPASGGWTRVRVIDNGVGIAPEDRERVFESFERARATEYDGTGLGLAICRHIVERHGGTIGVATPPGWPGTCIELTLPVTAEAYERASAPHA